MEVWSIGVSQATIDQFSEIFVSFARICSGAWKGTHKQSILCEMGWLPFPEHRDWYLLKFASKMTALAPNHRLNELFTELLVTESCNKRKWRLFRKIHSLLSDIDDEKLLDTFGSKSFKSASKFHIFDKLSDRWQNSQSGGILRAVKPDWTRLHRLACEGGSRANEKTRAQLRMGWNVLNRTRARFRWGNDHCPHCDARETREHVLFHCPKYQESRNTLRDELNTLDVPFDTPTILGCTKLAPQKLAKIRGELDKFITATGRFKINAIVR
jgi:hypothetical protein